MDLIDRANQHAERMLAAQLDNQLGRGHHLGESLHLCEACDDQIPEARRHAVPGVRLSLPAPEVRRVRGKRAGVVERRNRVVVPDNIRRPAGRCRVFERVAWRTL